MTTPRLSANPPQDASGPDPSQIRERFAAGVADYPHLARQVAAQIGAYLQQITQPENPAPVLPPIPPEEMLARWPGQFGDTPMMTPSDFVAQVLCESHHLHHPHYIGHQVAVVHPLAAVLEMLSALLNNGSAVYEMGPANTVMEKRVIEWMAQHIGFGPEADGILTSGGSLGNLTALLAARQAVTPGDYWENGHPEDGRYAVLVSEKAHYSVKRAVQILGWGAHGVIPLGVDEQYRVRPDALATGLETARKLGRRVVAVVGSACNTATGTFDPLPAMAGFCREHRLWFHVDGAHGAATVLSPTYRHLVDGIGQADSVVWDAHKMMQVPALNTAVLFRNRAHARQTFAQKAEYLLREHQAGEETFDLAERTLECTKKMMAMVLYGMLATQGTRYFADVVTATYDLTRQFAAMIEAHPRFELGAQPESNIICFRYTPPGLAPDNLDRLQQQIRKQIVESGCYYIVQTRLKPGMFLRCTLMNPLTTVQQLQALLTRIEQTGRSLLEQDYC